MGRAVLEIARGNVVEDRVPEDVIEGVILGNVLAPEPDDDGELDLPVESRRQPLRKRDRIAWTDHRRRRLREVNRQRRRRVSGLSGMGRVVLAKAEDILPGPDNRRVTLHPVSGIGEARFGILRQVVGGQLRGKSRAQRGGMPPRMRTGRDQLQHVRRQTRAVMEMRIASKIEDRPGALAPQPRRTRFDRVGTESHRVINTASA